MHPLTRVLTLAGALAALGCQLAPSNGSVPHGSFALTAVQPASGVTLVGGAVTTRPATGLQAGKGRLSLDVAGSFKGRSLKAVYEDITRFDVQLTGPNGELLSRSLTKAELEANPIVTFDNLAPGDWIYEFVAWQDITEIGSVRRHATVQAGQETDASVTLVLAPSIVTPPPATPTPAPTPTPVPDAGGGNNTGATTGGLNVSATVENGATDTVLSSTAFLVLDRADPALAPLATGVLVADGDKLKQVGSNATVVDTWTAPSSTFVSVARGADGSTWAGLASGGLVRFAAGSKTAVTIAGVAVAGGPKSIAAAPDGSLWVAGAGQTTLRVLPDGTFQTIAVPSGADIDTVAMTFDATGNAYVLGGNAVKKVSPQGTVLATITGDAINNPRSPVTDENNHIWVICDTPLSDFTLDAPYNLVELSTDGTVLKTVQLYLGQWGLPNILRADGLGHLYVEQSFGDVTKVSTAGELQGLFRPFDPTSMTFNRPMNVDRAGGLWFLDGALVKFTAP